MAKKHKSKDWKWSYWWYSGVEKLNRRVFDNDEV